MSSLTSADGAYGSIDYGYNAGGDRTIRDWSKPDPGSEAGAGGTLQSERYTYKAATARLLGVALVDPGSGSGTGGAGNLTPLRDFTYNASGQVVSDNRSGSIYDYGINARGRMTTVSLGGTEIAAYTYDESEQRIIKTAPGSGSGASAKTTHYHYDLEGRLIAETDGTTGETLREYVWLGLMPIAVIAQTESEPEGECNPALIEALEAELATTTAAADALLAQIIEWDGNIELREAKIAQMRAQLEGLSGKKREKLEAKIAKWESLISSTEARLVEAEAELAAVNAQITDIEEALTTEQAICAGTVTGTQAGIFYLHADHLGRPQFATDEAGMTVWDMGDQVTPFGEGVNLAGAFAQKLMFPGQYADEETGEEIVLSHNWHRTYDPTLGRYLQSDPIGLAGGLNRYAYVGGNPVGNVDPDGLRSFTISFNFNIDFYILGGGSIEYGFFYSTKVENGCKTRSIGTYKSTAKGWGYDISIGGGFEVSSGSPEELYQGRYSEFEASVGPIAVNGSRSTEVKKTGVDGKKRALKAAGGGVEIPLPGLAGVGGVHSAWGNSEILGKRTLYDSCECQKD